MSAPEEHVGDREQSDADNTAAVASQTAARSERAEAREQAEADHAVTVERLDRLIEASDAQTASNEKLALAMVEYQERAKTATRRFRITLLVVAVVFAVLYWRQNTAINSGHSVGHLIADCVQPSGKCFKDSQERTGKLVGSLNQVATLAAACSADAAVAALPIGPRIDAIDACIRAHFKK